MTKRIKSKLKKLPLEPGVYFFKNSDGKFLYIGKAKSLKKRVKSYFQQNNLEFKTEKMISEAQKLDWIETESEIEALLLEAEMIKRFRPPFNIDLRDDKSYLYIGISWGEEYPRLFYIRRPNLSDKKNRYFGPYTSVYALKSAMYFLRRIFPYRTCGKIPHRKDLFYQMYHLPAPCDRSMGKSEYRRYISQLMMFLKGKKKELIKKLKSEMKKLSRQRKYEQAAYMRDRIYNLEHLQRSILTADAIAGNVNIPARIEGYDISNISGKEATGSMVVFSNGEPDKDEYRKFKIKTVQGANDVMMLAEVLKRRFKNDWPIPKLIIIDGGLPQLNIARKILLEETKLNIPIVAIAKGPTRKKADLYFAGRRVLDDEKLIRQVRDEAHRFAIAYHKKLREKKMTG